MLEEILDELGNHLKEINLSKLFEAKSLTVISIIITMTHSKDILKLFLLCLQILCQDIVVTEYVKLLKPCSLQVFLMVLGILSILDLLKILH